MAGILDILGQSKNTSLAPAGGSPSYAPTAPVPGAASTGRNPFSSAMASDSPGILGWLGRMAGNPSTDIMEMQSLGGQQAAGLAGLQQRIDSGMPPQAAVVDFIGSPEGQQFFGTSRDPIGAIKGYLQLSQKPADEFITASPGSSIVNKGTGEITGTAPTTEGQNADKFLGMADWSPEDTKMFAGAMLNKMSSTTENKTQREAAVDWMVAKGMFDEATGMKWKAGLIQIGQPRDAAGNPLGPPVASDFSDFIAGGMTDPSLIRTTAVGANNGGATGSDPAMGQSYDPAVNMTVVPGDIIFAAGITGNASEDIGGIVGQFRPELSGEKYSQYRTALNTIFADVTNLADTNSKIAAEAKLAIKSIDKSGYADNPLQQGQALLNLHSVVDSNLAQANALISSNDPKVTGDVKGAAAKDRAMLMKIQSHLPSKASLIDAMLRAQQGEGTIQEGLKKAGQNIGNVVQGIEDTGAAALGAAEEGASATGKAARGQGASGGGIAPPSFKNEQEAAAAANSGKLKPDASGKIHVIINGVERTFSQKGQ